MKYQTLSVRSHITEKQIENLLYCAGQGSKYWSENELEYESCVTNILDNGYVVIKDFEDDINGQSRSYFMSMTHVKQGLTCMAKKYPHHFASIITENEDSITGDVFLQCCLFGEVRYS